MERTTATLLALTGLLVTPAVAADRPMSGGVRPEHALVYLDFADGVKNRSRAGGELAVRHGLRRDADGRLEFTNPRQYGELDRDAMAALSRQLVGAEALSVGGWFWCRRAGEQAFLSRGEIETGPLGERLFPPGERFVNFCLGTDRRGFLLGTINGNGRMPFPHVTVNEVPIHAWQQLVVVKDSRGHHHFYQNGRRVHSDEESMHAPARIEWPETAAGADEALRLRMPLGGLVAEAWVLGRALSPKEVAADYRAKRTRYRPAPPGEPVALRLMFSEPPPSAKPAEPFDREGVRRAVLDLLGSFPSAAVPLRPQVHSEEDCGEYLRRKVSFQVQPGERMPAYLLIPKGRAAPLPAVICFYGTTGGAGKQVTVGLSGLRPGSEPERNMSFALDVVEAGLVALAPDYLRDGERIAAGDRPYDTTRFYERFPDWSVHGKDVWDTMRAVDYLQSLDFVDGGRIGMLGHSYGGHSTVFAASLEPRIKAAAANGPVSAFREHGGHWAVPKGAANSQSLPALRPYLLDPERPLPVTFAEWTALIAPRPLWIGQAVGEHRPREESNCGFVSAVYGAADAGERVRYVWYAGDHDFPPPARSDAVGWLTRWLAKAPKAQPASP
jgi:dienelactone hydrolase